ncbi:unnamed protein product, partial [Allacma fusca]
LTPPLINCSAN